MSILLPSTLGGAISASDSDAISSDLGADGLPVGTKVWNINVGAFFTLTVSTASLVTDQILAVKNSVGTRWIKDAVSIPDNTITAAMLATSDKAALTAFFNASTSTLKGMQSAADNVLIQGERGLSTVISGGAVQTMSISSGLTGDTDGGYEIEGFINTTNAAPTYSLYINGANVGHSSGTYVDFAGTVSGLAIQSLLYIGTNFDANASFLSFRVRIGSLHGVLQPFNCQAFSGRSDYARNYTLATAGQFTPAAEITSIGIRSSAGSTIDNGSTLRIRKLGFTA